MQGDLAQPACMLLLLSVAHILRMEANYLWPDSPGFLVRRSVEILVENRIENGENMGGMEQDSMPTWQASWQDGWLRKQPSVTSSVAPPQQDLSAPPEGVIQPT